MKSLSAASLLTLSALLVGGCPYVTPATTECVRVTTTLGEFVIQLDPARAPVTVWNFVQYVQADFYDGTIFHRVIPGFVVQGGGLTAEPEAKETRAAIPNESDNGLSNLRGTVGMARTEDPDSATAQFYVNLVDNLELDATAEQPGYAVFGHVIEGMDVVDRIAAVATEERGGFTGVPVEDVIIVDAERFQDLEGSLELTTEGEAYLESFPSRTLNVARELLVQLVGFLLFPP